MKRSYDKRGHRWHTHRYLLGKVLNTVANIEMQICFEIGTHSLSAYLPRMPKSNGISQPVRVSVNKLAEQSFIMAVGCCAL